MPVTNDALTGDPLVGFNFKLDVSGKAEGYFTEVSGISSENEVTEHKIVGGGDKEAVRKIPGRLKWGDMTFKRGITKSMDFWEWRKMVEQGNVSGARANCTITMYGQDGASVAEWTLEAAWPSKITGPSMSTESSAVGVEELTVVCEGFARVK
jgi:phage tail-like protein